MAWMSKDVSKSREVMGVALDFVLRAFRVLQAVWKVARVVVETLFTVSHPSTDGTNDSMPSDQNNMPDVETPLIDRDDDSQTCGSCMKSEFKTNNVLLEYHHPGLFAQSQFGGQTLFLVWKVFAAIFTIALTGVCITLDGKLEESPAEKAKWLLYLGNWSLLLLMLSAVVELAVTIHMQMHRQDLMRGTSNSPMPWYLKVCWVLYNIATPSAFCASILYWTLVYDPAEELRASHIMSHGFTSVYAFLNLVVTGIPSRVLHCYQPPLYFVTFAVFSAIYQNSGGTNNKHEPAIVPFIDWYTPGRTFGILIGALFLAMTVHLVVCAIAFFRTLAAQKCKAAYRSKRSRTQESYELE